MRYCGVVQRIYKAQKRPIRSVRHIGYWKRRNCGNSTYIKKQYVSKGKKNKRIAYPSRAFKIQVENFSHWVVQKAQWKIRLQRV